MKSRKMWVGITLIFILSACIIPFEKLFETEQELVGDDKSVKEEIQQFFEIGKDKDQTALSQIDIKFAAADEALFAGAVDKALNKYQEAYWENDTQIAQARALNGLGRAYFIGRNYYAAIDAFNRILGQYPDTEYAADAYFLLGQVYEEIDEYQQAINAYSRYIQLRPGLIDYIVYEKIGDIALSIGDYNLAIYNFQAALTANPDYSSDYINLQIGKAYDGLEDYITAVQYFKNVYESAQDDYTKSTANLLAGQAYLSMEMTNDAYTHFLDSVIKFPKAYDSFTALTLLINDGVPVDDYLRGIVDYYAGSYEAAIRAFQSYLDSNPDNNDGTAYYFLGLSHYFADNPREAISAYENLITNFPANPYWAAAWDEKAFVQWAILNEYSNGSSTLVSFVNSAPTSPDAAAFLYEAGRILERNGDLEGAANIWQRMMNEYPSNIQSYRALFLAGISYYRLSRFEEALSVFQRALVLGTSPEEKAKAYLWIGKTYQQLNDIENAESAWQQGELADPTDYYSIRSGELLRNLQPLTIDTSYDLGYDLNLEKDEAEAWMRKTFNIADEIVLNDLDSLGSHPSILRIEEFCRLGMYSEAITEAETLRKEIQADVVNTYRLMNFLVEKYLYQPAVYACRNILDLAGMDDLSSLSAPIYFTHIRFGAYFRELIVESANEYDFHPLLIFSVIRRESLFNPFIFSVAGASGLTQIMPVTGQENADLLNWPQNYEHMDLLRGEVSIALGTYYLRRIQDYFDGNLYAALAGFNGGWGYAINWLPLSENDPDLFLEIIRFQETQIYIRDITEYLNIYKLIYTRLQ